MKRHVAGSSRHRLHGRAWLTGSTGDEPGGATAKGGRAFREAGWDPLLECGRRERRWSSEEISFGDL
jgi:hypothetical protein